jgi:crotonobetainyl-CoA:carnitine CoA-transferase CaiB-like acyl-CoA transferase
MPMSDPQGPLHGVTVLDLGQIYNAPYATFLMALAGARIIKVEPKHGDNLRSRGKVAGAGAPFLMLNSNKQAVTLDLKQDKGKDLLRRMARRVDVLVENFRPGVMDRLGLSPDALRSDNERLIYAAGSGFGSTGPYKDYPAMDLTIQAMSGVMAVTGYPDRPPVKAGPAIGDFLGGIHLYGAIVTALYERERTGVGTYVEVAMLDAIYPSMMSSLGLFFGGTGDIPTRTANQHSGLAEAPYNVYPATDGFLALICVTDAHWSALIKAMDRPDLNDRGDLSTRVGRCANLAEVDEIVGSWTVGYEKEVLAALLRAHGVPCAPVREIGEVVRDPHLHDRRMLNDVDHPQYGRIVLPHSPLHVGDFHQELSPAPELGEHNRAVYGEWLGVNEDEYAALVDEGVI